MNKVNLTFFNLKYLVLIVSVYMASGFASMAQNVTVSAQMDSTMIFIGGQIDLKIQMSQPQGLDLSFPILTDTITKNIEIVRANPVDTINSDNQRLLLEQSFRITSFDSGLHYVPPIVFEQVSEVLGKPVETNHMSLMVINPFEEVDPQKGIVDIKMPMSSPFHISELYKYFPWVLGIILLSGIITLAVLKYFGRDIPVKIFKKEKPKVPPHITALEELDKIKAEKLWQRDLVKDYYSRMTDTLRHYIEERYKIHAMEQTSDEIMDSFKMVDDIDKKSLENLNQILQTSDLVKFAKHEPFPDENDLSMINSYFFINQTKIEEIKTLEEEKAAMLTQEEPVEEQQATKS